MTAYSLDALDPRCCAPAAKRGEVVPGVYHQWLAILLSGNPARFAGVPRDHGVIERLDRSAGGKRD
jgi:hypothetical protein